MIELTVFPTNMKTIHMPAVSLRYLAEPVDEQGVALDLNIVLQSGLVPQKVLHQGNTLGWKDQFQKKIK